MTVNEILWSTYGWVATGDVEQPDPDVVAEALKQHPPEAVAAALDASVRATAAQDAVPPRLVGHYGSDEPMYRYTRHRLFSGSNHFRTLTTAQALGLQPPDVPIKRIPPARTVSDWWANQAAGYNRLGEPLCSPEELARRDAQPIPLAWAEANLDPLAWRLLNREGFPPARLQSYYGLSAAQVLENLWTPGTWLPTRPNK